MKNKIRKILFCALALICVGACVGLVWQQVDKVKGNESYESALAVAFSPVTGQSTPSVPTPQPSQGADGGADTAWVPAKVEGDPYMEQLAGLNLPALRQVNEDVRGWISIPNTIVSYPVMQETNNSYYLNRTWEEKRNAVGSIFLEYQNAGDFSDYHTIIYGHSMQNDSMFGALDLYEDPEYWKAHPYIYIVSDGGVYRYEIFAAYRASVKSDTYRLGFSKEEYKQEYLDYILETSQLDTGIVPATTDKILTLSTCITGRRYSWRWVVEARLVMEEVPVA